MKHTLAVLLLAAAPAAAGPLPLVPRAHSHNDYYQPRPLLDALDNGFGSAEADIFLVDGELRVGHDTWELEPGRTLEKLYLDPLFERSAANDHRSVYAESIEFQLLVDIKDDPDGVLDRLLVILPEYEPMLTVYTPDSTTPGAVSIVLSGDRPIERARAMPRRLFAIDGRPADLDRGESPHLMPLISSSWRSHFSWRGEGTMPPDEEEWMRDFIARGQANGHRLRFWALPLPIETSPFYHDTGIDYINTDRPAELRRFLLEMQKETGEADQATSPE